MLPSTDITPDAGTILDNFALADALALRAAQDSLLCYLDRVIINAQPNPLRFGAAADPWQRELLAPMVPAFEHLAGLPGTEGYRGPRRFMHILARGHDKSSLEARMATWVLLAARRTIHGYILAADRDQGRLVIQAMEDEARLNPWAYSQIVIRKNVVTGPAGTVEVLPCDAASMYGLRGNLYICDEISNWKRETEWTAVYSGFTKTKPCLLVVLSNAGVLDSWQHTLYQNARKSKAWCLFHREGNLASWNDPKEIEELKRSLPPSEADRLFENRWIDPAAEFDYLRRHEVEDCAQEGIRLGLCYRPRSRAGVSNYVAAVDYGPKRDRTALAVVHQEPSGTVVVDRLDVWEGKDCSLGRVPVSDVQDWIANVRQRFSPAMFVLDNYQMEGTAQWAEGQGIPVERFSFRGGAGNYELAQCLRALVVDRRLVWYEGCGLDASSTLTAELIGLRVKRMPYGYRFDHEAQKHDDMAFAVGIAAMRALEYPASPRLPGYYKPSGPTSEPGR